MRMWGATCMATERKTFECVGVVVSTLAPTGALRVRNALYWESSGRQWIRMWGATFR